MRTISRRLAEASPVSNNELAHLHPLLQRIYRQRGVQSAKELNYALAGLNKPQLKGLDQAITLLSESVEKAERILIVGDFDADGATSTALALRAFNLLGHRAVDFLVPNRFEFGYGLTPEIVKVAAEKAPDVIVTVDNGISSIEGVAEARRRGIKVIVTDHHLPADQLPEAHAIVNPNQPGCPFESKHMAGVGVIFYVMNALRSHLLAKGWFGEHTPPKLTELLDLVALGTVADVVRLDHGNRVLVSQGISRIRAGRCSYGIQALFEVAGKHHKDCRSTDLGFIVGPRLNAAGRMEDMSLGIQCLLADDPTEAQTLAHRLDQLNRERRATEASIQKEALAALEALPKIEKGSLSGMPSGLCFYQSDWHQGVIGIVASRLKECTHRPVIVFAPDKEGYIKGSGRSVPQVHLRDVLDDIARSYPGLLSKFGGHAMAAGLSLVLEDLPQFKLAFDEAIQRSLAGAPLDASILSDGEVNTEALSLELAEQIQSAGPWGQGFEEPRFDGVFSVKHQRVVGEKHLKLVLASTEQATYDAIAFNVDEALLSDVPSEVQVAYKLGVNDYRGRRSLQLMIDHIEAAKNGG